MISDAELRLNHEFVSTFETVRKRHGHREMDDLALRDVADATGVAYETMRVARHLRNALAHGEQVNRDTLAKHHRILAAATASPSATTAADEHRSRRAPSRAYRVHAWLDPRLEEEMLANGFVAVGGAEIGDLSGVTDAERIREWLTMTMPARKPRAISLFVGYWRRFLWEAESGDLVVLPTRRRDIAIGEFVGPYHYVADAQPRARHRRPVAWMVTGIPRTVFGSDLVTTLNGQHTVQEFTAPHAVERLVGIAATLSDPGPASGGHR